MSTRAEALLRAISVLTVLAQALEPLAAQTPDRLRFHLFTAAYDAQGGLPFAPILSESGTAVSFARFSAVPAVGLGLELPAGGLPLSVRLTGSTSLGGEEVGRWGCADPTGEPLACPSILIEVPTRVSTRTATLDAVGALPLGLVTVRPLLGVAWVRRGYEWNPDDVGAFSLQPGSHTDDTAALHYGVGASVALTALRVELEYAEYRSKADRVRPGRTAAATFGVSVPIG